MMDEGPIMGGHCYVMLNELMDSHLVCYSIPYTSWRIFKLNILYTFFTSVQYPVLKEQTHN